MKGFDFEEERIKREITKLGAKRVLLQLPEGLKPEAPRLAKVVEETSAVPIISADPCYGPCDLAITAAESLSIDLIVHFGHAQLLKHEAIPTLYVEARAAIPVAGTVEESLSLLSSYSRVGLATTVQHIQTLAQAGEILLNAGKTVVVGDAGRLHYPGQVTGCDYSNVRSIANEVDAFLFIGGGRFHAIGVSLSASKPTLIADPYKNLCYSLDEEVIKILNKRFNCIEEAKNAMNFGVLVALKPGQKHLAKALSIKEEVEKMGKTASILVVREVLPETLLEFPTLEAYVNTACQRVSFDFPSKFPKPVLTLNEFMVVCGEYSWEILLKKGLFEN